MKTRIYRVFLAGGDSFVIEAAGYRSEEARLVFHDTEGQPLKEVMVKVDAVIAVVPSKKKKKKKKKPAAPEALPEGGEEGSGG